VHATDYYVGIRYFVLAVALLVILCVIFVYIHVVVCVCDVVGDGDVGVDVMLVMVGFGCRYVVVVISAYIAVVSVVVGGYHVLLFCMRCSCCASLSAMLR